MPQSEPPRTTRRPDDAGGSSSAAPSRERVASALRSAFDLGAATWESIVGGRDRDARVWSVVDDAGIRWAVKWTRKDNRFGLLLAARLSGSGTPGIPLHVTARDGRPWADLDGGRLSVSQWVDGREAFEGGLHADEWRAFGRLVRAVHETPVSDVSDLQGVEPARRGIRRAEMRARRRLVEIDALVDVLGEQVVTGARRVVVTTWPQTRERLLALQTTARALKVTRTPTRRVTCHGDPHLGNVLVDDEGQPWLIDFDDAVRAPKEVDIMLIELGVLFALPVTVADRAAFHRGYGDVALDEERLVRFGCVRAVEDIVDTAHAILGAEGPALESPGAVLDTAGTEPAGTEPAATEAETADVDADLVDLYTGLLSETGLLTLVESRAARLARR